MTKKSRPCSFIDTDIIIKVGNFPERKMLSEVLLSFGYELYIHEYIFHEEVIFKDSAMVQLQEMLSNGKLIIMSESDLSKDELNEYNAALQLLADELEVNLHSKRSRDAGEVKSMAMAYAKGFEYFISDDRKAKVAANRYLQNLDGSYLKTIQMRDVIVQIKENSDLLQITRRSARKLFLYPTNLKNSGGDGDYNRKIKRIADALKKDFDNNLWPLD